MEFHDGNKTLMSSQATEHALHVKLTSADRLLIVVLVEYRNVTARYVTSRPVRATTVAVVKQ
jgi:hypothetical protein